MIIGILFLVFVAAFLGWEMFAPWDGSDLK
jgi:hypothetical protein